VTRIVVASSTGSPPSDAARSHPDAPVPGEGREPEQPDQRRTE
jgi:hypothetical protein